MITVAEYNDVKQLKPLADLWARLFERTPEACFSHSWEWAASLDSTSHKLRILLALVGGRPFGLLPMQVETRKTEAGELRVLTNTGSGFFPFAGPIGPNTTAMLTAAMRHLRRSRRDWDLVEFDLVNPTEMEKQRLSNTFQLMKWRCDAEASSEWIELSPNAELPKRLETQSSRYTIERVRAEDYPGTPWPVLASCLSLVEETQGSDAARQLRSLHQAAFRAGLSDWSLLREDGIPRAAALHLLTRGRRLCTALVGHTDTAKFELVHRMLAEAQWEEDLPFLFRSTQIPFAASWLNATPAGFRYTHVSPWAFRARWLRLRQRIQSLWNRKKAEKVPPNPPESRPIPTRPKLAIFRPSPAETLNV